MLTPDLKKKRPIIRGGVPPKSDESPLKAFYVGWLAGACKGPVPEPQISGGF